MNAACADACQVEPQQAHDGPMPRIFALVLGMHRSGTSLMTHILAECGFFAGPAWELIPPSRFNRRGHFERWPVYRANQQILEACKSTWDRPPAAAAVKRLRVGRRLRPLLGVYRGKKRAVIKDPRMCLTFPVWAPLFGDGLRVIRIVRDSGGVAASLAMRDGFSMEKGRRLAKTYNERADAATGGCPRFYIRFEDLFSPRREQILFRLARFLKIDADLEAAAARIVDPGLRHHGKDEVSKADGEVDSEAADGCAAAERLVAAGRTKEARRQLSALADRFPRNAAVENDLGVLDYLEGRKRRAVERFRRALRRDPGHRRARENLAKALGRASGGAAAEKTEQTSEAPLPAGGAWWDYPRFRRSSVRVLLINLRHLLMKEIENGLQRLGHECRTFLVGREEVERGPFIGRLTQTLREFKPDFVLTVDHLGFDQEGAVTDMLTRFRIPFASWYVDSPHLIIHHYERNRSPYLTLFMWDEDYVDIVRGCGFENVAYLPLGVDETQFRPIPNNANPLKHLASDVAFVGNSMVGKVRSVMSRNRLNGPLSANLEAVAKAFEKSGELIVRRFLQREFPPLAAELDRLPPPQAYGFETAVTWEATGRYRAKRVRRLGGFRPLVAGDVGWERILGENFRLHRELNYYRDLPFFYNAVTVNFNATSRQMKNGVNQRVFDVPACRRLLITDRTMQLEKLLEPGKEVLAYRRPEEIFALAERALKDAPYRKSIALAGWRRVISTHTYRHRMERMIETMERVYR